MPEAGPSREEVEAAVAAIQQWPNLARSPQLSRFLDYIVRAKLEGNEASIKAYSIAVDVLGRPSTFDPQTDPIVRVQAGRLRATLDEYYRSEGAGSPVRIRLPVGGYVPEFELQNGIVAEEDAAPPAEPEPAAAPSARSRTLAIVASVLALVAIIVALTLTLVFAPRRTNVEVPQVPVVAISEFTGLAGEDGKVPSVAGLAIELVTDLQHFDDLRPIYVRRGSGREPHDLDTAYQLTGIARRTGSDIQVTASLKDPDLDSAVWSKTVTVPYETLHNSIDDISQAFADELGSHRGPIHADANLWVDKNPDLAGMGSEYLCGLLFTRYRDSGRATDADRAQACLADFLQREPNSPRALAMRGNLMLEEAIASQPPGRLDPEPLAEVRRLMDRAVSRAPISSLVWELYARFLEGTGRTGEAEAAYSSALQLNPANLDALAAYGRFLSLRGRSPRGAQLADDAISGEPTPPHWYYAAPAVNALREGSDGAALQASEKLVVGDAELGSVVATVAAYRSRSEAELNKYFAQLVDVTRFRRFGIVPILRQRIPDTDLVDQIAAQLVDAGVAPAALRGPS